MRIAPLTRVSPPIRLEAVVPKSPGAPTAGSSALELAPDAPILLHFTISARDPEALEALRYARRSLLREEWTLGRAEGESLLQDAVFTSTEVIWQIPRADRDACVRKLDDLISRANRLASDS